MVIKTVNRLLSTLIDQNRCFATFSRVKMAKRKLEIREEQEQKRRSFEIEHDRKPQDLPMTICVEGNIASGKTTFIEHFRKYDNIQLFEEPVKKWRNVQGHNLLGGFYQNPDRLSLTLQTYVQLTMLDQHTKQSNKQIKLMERSIYSAKYCFVENLHKSGKMNDLEYVVLTEWFDWIKDHHNLNVDLIIYLRTKPETVFDRVIKRGRGEEKPIPLEYLENLHQLHDDWLLKEKFELPANVKVLDGNADVEDVVQEFKEYEEKHSKKILCAQT